jgi:hypothetical protein
LRTENLCAMIQMGSEITELYDVISKELEIKESCPIGGEKGRCMQITLTKEQVREAFGELRFMGADACYHYDRENKKKTEEVEALKLHLGSMKLGNSVDIRLEATELPKIEPYAVVELEEAVYSPYVQRGNFPVLVERITCKGIRSISSKQV